MGRVSFIVLGGLLAVLPVLLLTAGPRAMADTRHLDTLREDHPRLLLDATGLAALKAAATSDATLAGIVEDVLRRADRDAELPQLTYDKRGPRLLHVSRECLRREWSLGMGWRWTGEQKYADALVENLLTVCAFDDWNPSHFLDTAEMSHAVGLGYDWLYDVIEPQTREHIRASLVRLGLQPGIDAYEGRGPSTWWPRNEHNWNQVCNSGLSIGALAIAEDEPELAEQILSYALESLPIALATYAPDGAWGEGPGYWNYATRYTAYGIAAMESALGTDFGLKASEGLSEAGYFPIHTTGPTGLYLNYADSGERAARRPMGVMFWLARAYDNADYAASEHAAVAERGASAEHLVWYVPPPDEDPADDLARMFRGPVEVAMMRSAWNDPHALFVGVKAGYNQVAHGHLDLGTFEMDALGVRWARDLGSDDYNMPGYWNARKGGRRWDYYRLNTFSHNVPTLDGQDQDAEATSKCLDFTAGDAPHALIDVTEAYAPKASRAIRGVALVDGKRAALAQDEFTLVESADIAWGMTTDAEITIRDDGSALLRQDGETLTVLVLSPTGAAFTVESAEQAPPQRRNEGVRRLMLHLPGQSGDVRVAVLFAPRWEDGRSTTDAVVAPLADW